ncbi:hypothetical protein [Fidelibacter multiformis]|jgi:hypothetical protein|uniref:hypothetical protein n=1 Tax=Fidelibacter multiformis TaxID=3377529 RepID=UPI0037DDC155
MDLYDAQQRLKAAQRRLIIQAALRAVQWLRCAKHSSTVSQCSKKKSSHLLKSAKLGLKTERSEILERCAAAFESRVAAIELMNP